MSAPDVRQAYDVMLTREQYGELHGIAGRTMQRYLAEGRIPGAVKDERDRWSIPSTAQLSAPQATSVVRQAYPTGVVATSDVRQAYDRWVPVAEYAAGVGTSVYQVRRAIKDGLIKGGNYGPGGTTIVVVPR
jgi:predicted site-specific integrase-resolvase